MDFLYHQAGCLKRGLISGGYNGCPETEMICSEGLTFERHPVKTTDLCSVHEYLKSSVKYEESCV